MHLAYFFYLLQKPISTPSKDIRDLLITIGFEL